MNVINANAIGLLAPTASMPGSRECSTDRKRGEDEQDEKLFEVDGITTDIDRMKV